MRGLDEGILSPFWVQKAPVDKILSKFISYE